MKGERTKKKRKKTGQIAFKIFFANFRIIYRVSHDREKKIIITVVFCALRDTSECDDNSIEILHFAYYFD